MKATRKNTLENSSRNMVLFSFFFDLQFNKFHFGEVSINDVLIYSRNNELLHKQNDLIKCIKLNAIGKHESWSFEQRTWL